MTPRRLVSQARTLRQDATLCERRLWSRLKNGQLMGWQFRRQHPIRPYVVDFACIAERIVIEADGGQHWASSRDARRDAYLESNGWLVLRFWNNEILTNMDGVIAVILDELRNSHDRRVNAEKGPHPTLPRRAGEGRPETTPPLIEPAIRFSEPPPLVPPPPLAGEGRGGGRGASRGEDQSDA